MTNKQNEVFKYVVFHTACDIAIPENSQIIHSIDQELLTREDGTLSISKEIQTQFSECSLDNINKDMFKMSVTENSEDEELKYEIFQNLYLMFTTKVFPGELKMIGEGSYNRVYDIAINSIPAVLRVVKTENKKYLKLDNKDEYKGAFIQSLLQKCEHVPKLYAMGILTDTKSNTRVFQLMENTGEDLHKFIKSNNLTDEQRIKHLKQIAESVKCMHSNDFIHRDIKLENFSIKNDKIYLLDFGAASNVANCSGIFTKTAHYHPSVLYSKYENTLFTTQTDSLKQRVKEYDIFALSVIIMAYIDYELFETYNKKLPRFLTNFRYTDIINSENQIIKELRNFAMDVFNHNVGGLFQSYNNESNKIITNEKHTIYKLINILNGKQNSGGKKLRKKVAKRKEEKTKKNVQKNRSTRKNKKKRKARRA